MAMPHLIEACRDPQLFAPWFKKPDSWRPWLVALKALFGLPMDSAELTLFQACTGRTTAPTEPSSEGWFIVGRRGGKSFITALVGVYLATFRDYTQYLAPGERGVIMVIAVDRRQARAIFRYVRALLEGVAMLSRMIEKVNAESIDLTSRISIEIHTASFRSVRGTTVVAALLDEIAFWRSDDSANPDTEILAALRPAMATIPGAMLIGISSPYSRRGVLFEAYRDHYGQGGNTLIWKSDTRTMNSTVPQRTIDRAFAYDPQAAASEYGAEFRSDLAAFLQNEWLDTAVMPGRFELPPQPGVTYHAFADPSGGGADSFTLAIAHHEGEHTVLDVLRGRHGSPDAAVREYSALLKTYGLKECVGDKYAAAWTVDSFLREGIEYKHSELSKSEVYLEALPMFATGTVRLLDNVRLLAELRQLERRTASSGKDTIDHPARSHDDHSNAACGALWLAKAKVAFVIPQWMWAMNDVDPDETRRKRIEDFDRRANLLYFIDKEGR